MQKTMQSKNRKKQNEKMKKWNALFLQTHTRQNEKMKKWNALFLHKHAQEGADESRQTLIENWELGWRGRFWGAAAARLWLRIERRWLEAITYSNRGQNPTGFRLRQQERATSWLEASTLGRVLRIMCWLPARGEVREEARVRNMMWSQLYNSNNLCWISIR